jgi:hypothetical protein
VVSPERVPAPGGLFDATRRPRHLRVVSNGDWYLAGPGLLQKVGFGELAVADLEAVRDDLGERAFLAHPEVRPLETYLRGASGLPRRMRWADRTRSPALPTVAGVARGAQVAVLPDLGVVWVDGEGLFKRDREVPLPWTDPLIYLPVVQPRAVIAVLRRIIGPGGPRRVQAFSDGD